MNDLTRFRKQYRKSLFFSCFKTVTLFFLPIFILLTSLGGYLVTAMILPPPFLLLFLFFFLGTIFGLTFFLYKKNLWFTLEPETQRILLSTPTNRTNLSSLTRKRVLKDPFPLYLALAFTFSLALNLLDLQKFWLFPLLSLPVELPLKNKKVEISLLSLTYPDGTTATLRNHDGFLEVEEGTWIQMEVKVKEKKGTLLLHSDTTTLSTPIQDGKGLFHFQAKQTLLYRFLLSWYGVLFYEPYTRKIVVKPDLPPEIRWVSYPPSKVFEGDLFSFSFRAGDDRSVRSVTLKMEGESTKEITLATFPGETVTDTGEQTVFLPTSSLPEGKVITLTLYAYDNDSIEGPNRGSSPPHTLTIIEKWEKTDPLLLSLKDLRKTAIHLLGDYWEGGKEQYEKVKEKGEEFLMTLRTVKGNRSYRKNPVFSISLTKVEKVYKEALRTPYGEKALSLWEEGVILLDDLLKETKGEKIGEIQEKIEQLLKALENHQGDPENLLQELKKLYQELLSELLEDPEELPPELVQKESSLKNSPFQENWLKELENAIKEGDREKILSLLKSAKNSLAQLKEALKRGERARLSRIIPEESTLEELSRKLKGLKSSQEKLLKELNAWGGEERKKEILSKKQRDVWKEGETIQKGIPDHPALGKLHELLEQSMGHMKKGEEEIKKGKKDESLLEGERARSLLEESLKEAEELRKLKRETRERWSEEEGEDISEGPLKEPPHKEEDPLFRKRVVEGFREGIPALHQKWNEDYFHRLLR